MKYDFLINKTLSPSQYLFRIILILLSIGFSTLIAQNKLDQLPNRILQGVYDVSVDSYYYREIDSENMKITHQYQVERFYKGVGVVEYTNLDEYNRRGNYKAYGVIDTNGRILIPLRYSRLVHSRNKDFFFFYNSDSIGIVNTSGKEIFKLAPKSDHVTLHSTGARSKSNNYFYQDRKVSDSSGFCVFKLNDKFGVYSFYKERIIAHAIYDQIEIFNNIAVCSAENYYTAYDCELEERADNFKKIIPLAQGENFYVELINGRKLVCSDLLQPETSINRMMNRNEVSEVKNKFLICRDSLRYGVINEKGEEIIPFKYENVFFMGINYFLVKGDGKWAIYDKYNQPKSNFVFLDVELQNKVNIKNCIQYSGIDTISYIKRETYSERQLRDKSPVGLLLEIQDELEVIKTEIQSHILSCYFNQSREKVYVLKTAEGYRRIIFWEDDIDGLKIDSFAWDNIFLTPYVYNYTPYQFGLQKGDKFGYFHDNLEREMKYDGIYFFHNKYYYDAIMFSGTSSYFSPYLYVKKGAIYRETKLSRRAWWSFYKNYHQGKLKMTKLKTKEAEFLKYREENMIPKIPFRL